MPVTSILENFQAFAGEIVIAPVVGQGQIDVRALINADISAFTPPAFALPAAAAYWGAAVKITEYDNSAVKLITGFPLRAQFGSLNYYSVTEIQAVHFIQNEVQYFRSDRCIVLPTDYLGAAFTIADIPEFTLATSFTSVSGVLSGLGLTGIADFTTGATGFYYLLTETVVASFNITYAGRFINADTGISPFPAIFLNL